MLEAIDREITLLESRQRRFAEARAAAERRFHAGHAGCRSRGKLPQGDPEPHHSAKQSISNVRDDYATNVKPKIDALASTVSTLISQTDSMITQLSGTADDLAM